MGGPGSGGGGHGGKQEAKPPRLPQDSGDKKVPQELRDFVDCRGDSLTLEPGEIKWMDIPGLVPTVQFEHGQKAGTVDMTITLMGLDIKVTAEVKDGQLQLQVTEVPAGLRMLNPQQAIDDWVKSFNDWMAAKGKRLESARLRRGKLTLTKSTQIGYLGEPGMPTGEAVAVLDTGIRPDHPDLQLEIRVDVGPVRKAAAGLFAAGSLVTGSLGVADLVRDGATVPAPVPAQTVVLTSADLEPFLLTSDALPGGYELQLPSEEEQDGSTGLCEGPREKDLLPITGEARADFLNEGEGLQISEGLFGYQTVSAAEQVVDLIRAQGNSCTTYESPNGFSIQIQEAAPVDGGAGVTFERLFRPADSPDATAFVQYLSFVPKANVVVIVATGSFDQAQARSIAEEMVPRAVDRVVIPQPQPWPAVTTPVDEGFPWGAVALFGGALTLGGVALWLWSGPGPKPAAPGGRPEETSANEMV